MSIKGFPSNQKLPLGSGITSEHATIQPTDEFRNALDVPRFAFRVGGNTPRVAAANTGNIDGLTWVYDTSTPARRGDFVRFETGAAAQMEVAIVKVETNRFLLGALVEPSPAPSDTFFIMRYATQRVDSDGTQLVSVAQSPVEFLLDSVATTVKQDTVTPSNSTPLPVRFLNSSGVVTNLATEATLASIDTKVATQTTLAAVDSKLGSIDTKVATETTLASIDTKVATQTTLAALDSKINDIRKIDGSNIFAGVGGATPAGVFHAMQVDSSGNVFTFEQGRTAVTTARLSYVGTPVNTTTWQQIVASLPSQVRVVEIFDSSGQTLELGTGPAASEVRQILIFPGGNGRVSLSLASGTRISIRAVSATADEGEISVNFYS